MTNQIPQNDLSARHIVQRLTENLSRHESVNAILLLGSLATNRGFDVHSDIDLGIFVKEDRDRPSLPFSFFVSMDARRVEVNLTQFDLVTARQSKWNLNQLEAFSNGVVLFDRLDIVREMIATKVSMFAWMDALIERLNQVHWRGLVHSPRCTNRGYILSSQVLLAEAFHYLIESLFFLNRQFPPHPKWWEVTLPNLPLQPVNLGQQLLSLGSAVACGEEGWCRLEELYNWILITARSKFLDFPLNLYADWASRLSGRQLADQTFVDLVVNLRTPPSPEVYHEVRDWLAFHAIKDHHDLVTYGRTILKPNCQFAPLSPPAVIYLLEFMEMGIF